MKKTIELGYYDNCYKVNEFNCLAQTFAIIADYYHKGNYYYYALYFSYFLNWYVGEYEDNRYINSANYILKKLGMKVISFNSYPCEKLLYIIKEQVINSYPVILFLRKKNLVYSINKLDAAHGIVIAGFDDCEKRFLIKDSLHVEQSGARYQGSGFGLFDLWLKEDLVIQMIEEQRKDLLNRIDDVVLCIYPDSTSYISSYYEIFFDIIKTYKVDCNKFIQYLTSNIKYTCFTDDVFCQDFRRKFLLSKKVFVDGLLRGANELIYYKFNDFEKFLSMFIRKYEIAINYISILGKRNKEITNLKRNDLINDLVSIDEKLILYLEDIVSNFRN